MISNVKECYICHSKYALERHHCIFGNADRKKSEEYDLTVWLCPECHRGTFGVHGKYGKSYKEYLEHIAMMYFIENIGSREDFFKVFKKYY